MDEPVGTPNELFPGPSGSHSDKRPVQATAGIAIRWLLRRKWTLRLLLLLGGICIGGGATYFSLGLYTQHNEREMAALLSVPMRYESRSLMPFTNSTCSLSTIWVSGIMGYQLRILQPTSYVREKQRNASSTEQFYLVLVDQYDFVINRSAISPRAFTGILDQSGTPTEFRLDGTIPLSKEDYQRIVNWSLGWDMLTQAEANYADDAELFRLMDLEKSVAGTALKTFYRGKIERQLAHMQSAYGKNRFRGLRLNEEDLLKPLPDTK